MTRPAKGYRRRSSQPKTGSSLRSSQVITTHFRRFLAIVAIVAVAGGPFLATVAITASLADCNYIYSSYCYFADEGLGRGTAKSATIATIALNPAENGRFRRRSALRRPATTATIAACPRSLGVGDSTSAVRARCHSVIARAWTTRRAGRAPCGHCRRARLQQIPNQRFQMLPLELSYGKQAETASLMCTEQAKTSLS